MSCRIAYLGPPGTNSHAAALIYANHLSSKNQFIACPTIIQSLQEVLDKKADLAIVPVENSIEGIVSVVLDELWKYSNLKIQIELTLSIKYALFSSAPSLDQIKFVLSHPQALGQCRDWLHHHLPSAALLPMNSTIEALEAVRGDLKKGAVASETATEFGIPILVTNICDFEESITRFWVIGLSPCWKGTRLSLGLTTKDYSPQGLLETLQFCRQHNLPIFHIESRPVKGNLGQYLFFIEINTDKSWNELKDLLKLLERQVGELRVFGLFNILPSINKN